MEYNAAKYPGNAKFRYICASTGITVNQLRTWNI